MVIHVEMTEEEMRDFLQYRREKVNRRAVQSRLQELAEKVILAIGSDVDAGFVIIDQDHAEDMMEMASLYIE